MSDVADSSESAASSRSSDRLSGHVIGLLAAIAAIFGLVFGSFINVVAYRVPEGRSVVNPPSACPHCGSPIRAHDNIPVLSWLLLRGRCRDCEAKISPRYPIVEAATGALFAAAVLVVGTEWVLLAYLWFVGVTIALILTDLDHKRIPNRILYPGTVAGVVLLGVGALLDGGPGEFGRALLGGAIYFAALLVLAIVARGGFGFGDVKLAFLLGLFMTYLGWKHLGVGVFLAFFIGGLISIVLLVTRRRGRKDAIPFGPSLIIGAWLGIAYGQQIADWYLRV